MPDWVSFAKEGERAPTTLNPSIGRENTCFDVLGDEVDDFANGLNAPFRVSVSQDFLVCPQVVMDACFDGLAENLVGSEGVNGELQVHVQFCL